MIQIGNSNLKPYTENGIRTPYTSLFPSFDYNVHRPGQFFQDIVYIICISRNFIYRIDVQCTMYYKITAIYINTLHMHVGSSWDNKSFRIFAYRIYFVVERFVE